MRGIGELRVGFIKRRTLAIWSDGSGHAVAFPLSLPALGIHGSEVPLKDRKESEAKGESLDSEVDSKVLDLNPPVLFFFFLLLLL